MNKFVRFGILSGALLLIIVTVLSMIESNQWWIRMWDFPRLVIFTLAVILALCAGFLLKGRWRVGLTIAMLLVAGWQGWRILPYTMLAEPEVEMVGRDAGIDPRTCFSALNLNVLQTNRDYAGTLDLIRKIDPDILLLLETDDAWLAALQPVVSAYPHRLTKPLSNKYGMLFYTKLPADELQLSRLVKNDTPSVFAQLRTRSGDPFLFIGLHPKPPVPGHDTDERDAEIILAASRARRMNLPTAAMGDFNDVAWSDTSQMFKRLGGYLDPRVGRGFYATYPAALPFFRWPLDHIFVTEQFAVQSISVLGDVGSDHLPVLSHVCLAPARADRLNEEPANVSADDREDAREIIRESDAEIIDNNINSKKSSRYVPETE